MVQTMVRNGRREYAMQCRDQSAVLRMQCDPALARARSGLAYPRFLTFKQAIEAGGNVRKGEHGTKVIFVKQLQIKDGAGEEGDTRLIPLLREYTVFNVCQCENLPDTITAGKPMRVRNPDHAMHWPMSSCIQPARTFGRGTARPTTCRAKISFRCQRSRHSRVQIIFIPPPCMSSRIGPATSRALTEIYAIASARANTRRRNWLLN